MPHQMQPAAQKTPACRVVTNPGPLQRNNVPYVSPDWRSCQHSRLFWRDFLGGTDGEGDRDRLRRPGRESEQKRGERG